jgi:hypothetical protein
MALGQKPLFLAAGSPAGSHFANLVVTTGKRTEDRHQSHVWSAGVFPAEELSREV